MKRAPLLAGALLLAGCSDGGGSTAWQTATDLLRGEPDAAALAERRAFEGGGIAFEHPAVLRSSFGKDEDGSHTWTFEHGMFELELYAPTVEMRAHDYLQALAEVFGSASRITVEAPDAGPAATICGRERRPARLRVRILGDWSEYQAFDLPAPAGEARMLIFDDEPVDGAASAVATATRAQVFASLTCDSRFVWPADVDDAARTDVATDAADDPINAADPAAAHDPQAADPPARDAAAEPSFDASSGD